MKRIIYFLAVLCCPVVTIGQSKHIASGTIKNNVFLKITINYEGAAQSDTLAIKLYTFYPFEYRTVPCTRGKDELYHCSVPVKTTYGYFSIVKFINKADTESGNDSGALYDIVFPDSYWEKGDDILIRINNKPVNGKIQPSFAITGKGALKYDLQIKANELFSMVDGKPTFDSTFIYHNPYGQSLAKIISILDSNRANLSASAYYVLKANYGYANAEGKLFFDIEYMSYRNNIAKKGLEVKKKFLKALADQKSKILHPVNVPDVYLSRSKEFIAYVLWGICIYENIEYDTYYSPRSIMNDSAYFKLKKEYHGELRDMVITHYLTEIRNPNHFEEILKDALATVKSPVYHDRLKELNGTRYPGRQAYDFNLPDSSGKLHSLKDFRGKVVFVDVWFTGCPGCADFYQRILSRIEAEYEGNEHIAFVSISMDVKKRSWESGLNSGYYAGDRSINLYTDGQGYSHPFIDYYHIDAGPTVMLINKKGQLVKFNTTDLYDAQSLKENINRVIAEE